MPPDYTQEGREIALGTPLGKDKLMLTAFKGKEEMSRLFEFQLDVISTNLNVTAKDIVGKSLTWLLTRGSAEPRYFNAIVSRLSSGALQGRDMRHYRLEVVPWLWLLTRTTDCRIFQNKSAPEIIEQIFKDLGQKDYELHLHGTHAKRDYCVQYRESDFNFVSRLMEEEGIFYWFHHENGKHKLVLADQKSVYKPCEEKKVFFAPASKSPNVVKRWDHRYELRPGKYAQTDYNFETPTASLMTRTDSLLKLGVNDGLEIYDYPGVYAKKDAGEALTKLRIEEEEATHDIVSGDSSCRTFTPGATFTLDSHECDSESGNGFLLTAVTHAVTEPTYTTSNDGRVEYHNSFTCIPDSVVFRPARLTPRPIVQGLQTAVVVGPKGEEIYTDKYGRIKVQFHWDREGKRDENSSCWMRVSTTWAGKGWGFQQIPRIGHEVIVDFLEGNPDRPIVTGSVYNADNMPAAKLPDEKATSGMKSATYPGSGGWNGMAITDTKQKEMVAIHAQKDMTTTVEHDETLTVHNNRKSTIDVDDTESVGSNQKITIGSNQKLAVGSNQDITVGSNQSLSVGSNQKVGVGADQTVGVQGARSVSVTGSDKLAVSASRTVDVSGAHKVTIGGSEEISVGGAQKLTVGGAQTFSISGAVKITSGASITLEVGGSSIKIGPGGIDIVSGSPVTVKGAVVKVNG
jgi:type VI secretion system secreted protein VgrG